MEEEKFELQEQEKIAEIIVLQKKLLEVKNNLISVLTETVENQKETIEYLKKQLARINT